MNDIPYDRRSRKVFPSASENSRTLAEERRPEGLQARRREDLSVADTGERSQEVFGETREQENKMNNSPEKTVRMIAIYARVSTAKQEEDGTIETQLAAVRDYARQNGYVIVKEYIDDGWSGDTLVRPALDELRQDVKTKLWEATLCYDPDRLARRYSYQELVMDELREAGVEVMFVTISAPKNSEDKILHGVRGLFAEYERAKISERFRLGKLRVLKEGHILVSQPLYGYSYIPKKDKQHGYYVINPEEARVVKMIFGWVANESMTIRQVVRKLQELGIKPRKSKRGVWNTSTLTTLLRNRAFVGEAHWRSSIAVVPENPTSKEKYRKIKKSSRKPRPKEEWIVVPVPVILDKDLFERARERLAEHAILCPRNKKYEYLLGGKIWCICNQRRTGVGRNRGRNLYYDCCDKVLCFPLPRACHERSINARTADKLVWQKLSTLMGSPELLAGQIKRWTNERNAKAKFSVGDTVAMEKQIAGQRQQEERYTKAYGAGLFSMEQLKEYTLPIRETISSLELQISKARQEAREIGADVLPSEKEISMFTKDARETRKDLNFEEKRAIVLNTVEKIIGTQKQLKVSGHISVLTNYGGFKTTDRNRRIAERG